MIYRTKNNRLVPYSNFHGSPKATTTDLGISKPDGETINVDSDGVLSSNSELQYVVDNEGYLCVEYKD